MEIIIGKKFKKDVKRQKKRGLELQKIDKLVKLLISKIPLPKKYVDHSLSGNWDGCRDCHLAPDWVLIYKIKANKVYLIRTGSHSDLF